MWQGLQNREMQIGSDGMIYGYARVSTIGQTKGNSLEDQERLLKENGATKIFKDAYTGTKMDRPSLSLLMGKIEEGDTFMVTKLDRIARSVKEGIDFFDSLIAKGIKVHVLNIGVMDDSPAGKLIRNIFLSFAEFERDMIVQRTQEGKAIARENPSYREGRPRLEFDITEYYNLTVTGDMTVTEACKTLGISRSTWYDRVRAMQ